TLTVNPLIRVCYFDDKLTLTAGALTGDLDWSVVDDGEEGRGSVVAEGDGRRCTYTAGSKVDANVAYVLDQVRVQNRETSESRSIYV
ncbi:hypothetical protein SB757_31015, partial [Pseudomonas sp. SIMBA_065]